MESKVEVNYEICRKLGEHLESISLKPFNWIGQNHPETTDNAEKITNYYFIVVAQDFGFWFENVKGYDRPMYAIKNGYNLKGADFLWATSFAVYKQDPKFFSAETMKNLNIQKLKKWLSDDSGKCPLPMKAERLKIAKDLGKRLCKHHDGTFSSILLDCSGFLMKNGRGLLESLNSFTGYGDSPFYKKALLLAKILSSRPEGFLQIKDKQNQKVILDYHLLRMVERTGMIEILNSNLIRKLENREWVSPEEEYVIREKALEAFAIVCRTSKKNPFAIDDLFWNGRKFCPEMQEPECGKCLLRLQCKGSKNPNYRALFQPILRTSSY